jgi:peptide/nickel transport system substrate-binding protein
MQRTGLIRRAAIVGLVVAAMASGTVTLTATPGGAATPTTATFAEQPQALPNYIFPFMSLAYFSVYNSEQFQYLMYRPLYWFGNGSTPNLDPALSLAQDPVYSADTKTVTVDLKPYAWSNGETLTAQNVMLWMNMLHAEKANWAGYSSGAIPDDLKSVTVDSPTQLTFTLSNPVNTYWFTYNELSQITPMPNAWDITAKGGAPNSGGCANGAYGTVDSQCKKVYSFLTKQSMSLSTYATSPIWGVVDGPWKLSSFNASGNVTFVPNPAYSGPVKPTLTKFIELPFTSESAEFNALVGGKVTVGYMPLQDVTKATTNPLKAGPNNPRLGNFVIDPLYTWSINYFPYNFHTKGTPAKIFDQLYFRQAVQYLVDQPLYIKKIFKGYAVGTYGPVPATPANTFVSPEVQDNPLKYSPATAISLLKGHGWKVVPNGTSTCQSPGSGADQCGAGIPKGAKLSFNLQFDSGSVTTAQLMAAEKSSWSQAGININLSQASFDTVTGIAVPCKSCSWQLENWGAGWIFSPDVYPTGEAIFQTGAGSNSGSYSDPTNDANIVATNVTQTPLTQYENYLAEQVPGVWQPNQVTSLTEIKKGISGVLPQNVFQAITPENWRY